MAIYYVWSGSSTPTSPYDSSQGWDQAAHSVADTFTAGATAGDTIYVHTGASSPHSESITGGDVTWNNGLSSGTTKIIGVDKNNSNAYAPTTTACVTLSDGSDLSVTNLLSIYGLCIESTSGGYFWGGGNGCYLQDCTFKCGSSTAAYHPNMYSAIRVDFKDCTFDNNSTSTTKVGINYVPCVNYIGCSWTGFSSAQALLYTNAGQANFIGCDFSGASPTLDLLQGSGAHYELFGCRLPSVGLATNFTNNTATLQSFESDTDSGNSSVRNEWNIDGVSVSCVVDTGVYRSGGATYDGTNNYSYLLNGTSTYQDVGFGYTPWNYGFLSSTGSTTFTAYIANATADYTDVQVWLEVEYFASSSNTLKVIASDKDDDPTSSGTTQTDDTSSTWSPSKTYMQKLSVTATVNRAGSYRWRVGSRVATDIYIDPKIEIT